MADARDDVGKSVVIGTAAEVLDDEAGTGGRDESVFASEWTP